MKAACVVSVCAVLLSAGCSTLTPAERDLLHRNKVAQPVVQRMVNYQSLALNDIVELSRRKVSDDFVIHYLRATGTVYQLKTADVVRLQEAGVRSEVIDYLLSTPAQAAMYSDRWWDYGSPGYYHWQGFTTVHRHHHHKHRR